MVWMVLLNLSTHKLSRHSVIQCYLQTHHFIYTFLLSITDSAFPFCLFYLSLSLFLCHAHTHTHTHSGNAAVIAVSLSDYVSGQIQAYPHPGSGRNGDGSISISRGCRVQWNQGNTLLNYPPRNKFPQVSFLISGMITVGSCRGCSGHSKMFRRMSQMKINEYSHTVVIWCCA